LVRRLHRPPAATATSAAPVQQLEPLASNIDLVRRSVEQLAAKQDQMAQNIATLQGVQEDIRQKMSYTPPSPSQQAASIPQPKPPQPKAQSSAAVLIGVGGTLAWQFYGDAAREVVIVRAPTLAWLLSVSTTGRSRRASCRA
jgi:hypothetical protein